ncbi:MAG: pentapeptide repeat-containing protein [Pedobacter sp.]|nr:MAG: pentapeptide repeat-containing protein [Pedobacter sp.]
MSIPANLDHFDQVFEKITHLVTGAKQTQFEDCTFKNCDLTEANFNGCNFINCSFINCNLSMVKFVQNGLDHIQFTDCKMVGADFSNAKDFLFGVNFSNCILDYGALMKKKNRKAKFENCSLKGADFTEADLTETKFVNCDFDRAIFMQSTLNGANFISSFNYTIDPERNSMRKAKFAASGLAGLLTNYGIIVAE